MKTMQFMHAADSALIQAMAEDERIVVFGEDIQAIRHELAIQFGKSRVFNAPISESAFIGAGVAAAMAGLRPVVEVYLVDFLSVAMDAIAKLNTFSGGTWQAPIVIRTTCGGGYGDGGQHAQSLWGWLAHIPDLVVTVPSTPADAGGLMLAACQHDHPVIFLEHVLLSKNWLDFLGGGSRDTVAFDTPAEGAVGSVPRRWVPIPFGQANYLRHGGDISIVSLGVSVHRAAQAAKQLAAEGMEVDVIDLRTVAPLDADTIIESVSRTGKLLVVDEDYRGFGLTGELAAVVLENGLQCKYARVATEGTLPYNRQREVEALPNFSRILQAARNLF
ncbi:MAG: transketolase C-terminal domain-containing protein [Anaerolineales bacterium]